MRQLKNSTVLAAMLWVTTRPEIVVAEQRQAKGLFVALSTAKAAFREGEPIRLTLTIANEGPDWLVLIPRFGPPANSKWPELGLTVTVEDGSGKRIPGQEGPPFIKRARPSICAFVELHPTEFFGRQILLNEKPFRFVLPPGHYAVKTRLASDAREWLESEIRAGRVARRTIPFDSARLFEGAIESNRVEFEVE